MWARLRCSNPMYRALGTGSLVESPLSAGGPMKRRGVLKSFGDAAARSLAAELITVATPTRTWSQTAEKMRRVGVLLPGLSPNPVVPPGLQALVDGLRENGWEEGRNVVLEVRYADLDPA